MCTELMAHLEDVHLINPIATTEMKTSFVVCLYVFVCFSIRFCRSFISLRSRKTNISARHKCVVKVAVLHNQHSRPRSVPLHAFLQLDTDDFKSAELFSCSALYGGLENTSKMVCENKRFSAC